MAVDDLGSHLEVQLGGETRGPHHPQRVVGEGLLGRPGRAEHPRGQVFEAPVRVDELLLRQRHRHRVDGEVAADEVFLDGVAVGHLGLARGPVVRLGAVGRDLDVVAVLLAADRAEGDPDLPDRVRPGPHDLQYVLGAGIGREVQVVAEPPEQRVPDRAADEGKREPRLLESAGEVVRDRGHPQQFAHRAALHLAQCTGIVFVGVRHNRKGYVARPTGASPLSRPVCRCDGHAAARRYGTLPIMWSSPRHFATVAHRYHAWTQATTTDDNEGRASAWPRRQISRG